MIIVLFTHKSTMGDTGLESALLLCTEQVLISPFYS